MDAGAKASDAKPLRGKPRGNAADERGGCAGFLLARRSLAERYAHASKPLGDNFHGVILRGRGSGGNVPRDCGAEHDAELVVGVVSGKLRASRRAEQKCVRRVAEVTEIFLAKPRIARLRRVRRVVERCELCAVRSGGKPFFPRRNVHRIDPSGSYILYLYPIIIRAGMPCQQNSAGEMFLRRCGGSLCYCGFYSIPAISSESAPALTPMVEKKA